MSKSRSKLLTFNYKNRLIFSNKEITIYIFVEPRLNFLKSWDVKKVRQIGPVIYPKIISRIITISTALFLVTRN